MKDEILEITPPTLPFSLGDKIFQLIDTETGEKIGEPESYLDFVDRIKSISGVNEELLGKMEDNNENE